MTNGKLFIFFILKIYLKLGLHNSRRSTWNWSCSFLILCMRFDQELLLEELDIQLLMNKEYHLGTRRTWSKFLFQRQNYVIINASSSIFDIIVFFKFGVVKSPEFNRTLNHATLIFQKTIHKITTYLFFNGSIAKIGDIELFSINID